MTAPLRVVHVVVAGELGGAERMLADLASRPTETGAAHVVALMTPNARLAEMLRDAGLTVRDRGRVSEHPAAFLWRTLGPVDVAWLAGVMRGEGARVAHLHTFASQVIGTRAARTIGARVLRTEHSTRVYDDASCWPFSRWSLARADAVVAISRHVHEVAIAKAPWVAAKMRVVHNGVDILKFAPSEARAAETADARPPFRFVVVGRLERRKGIDLAIVALAETPGAELDIVGDGGERATLEALARARGVTSRVRFHGHLPDPRDVIVSADAALSSSRQEGLGIALLEAMAMERPVVGFAVGGVPESVTDGVSGWLTRESTSRALATRMADAMGERAELRARGRAARASVVLRFSIDRMCAGYRDVYAELALSRPSPPQPSR